MACGSRGDTASYGAVQPQERDDVLEVLLDFCSHRCRVTQGCQCLNLLVTVSVCRSIYFRDQVLTSGPSSGTRPLFDTSGAADLRMEGARQS